MTTAEKFALLKEDLARRGSLLIAFSGGVDSTFLSRVAHDVLGDRAVAATARSASFPRREYDEAVELAESIGIRHITLISEELEVEGFSDNPVNRCYLCKKELFGKLLKAAQNEGLAYVAEGSNTDDMGDYRPGLVAVEELGIISPLRAAGLTKEEISTLSKELGLPTWSKPSFACLASRFPYGTKITEEKLNMIDKAEQCLLEEGFTQVRVRHHGEVARIELLPQEISRMFGDGRQDRVYKRMKEIGFLYAAVDLRGYRTGSMNEGLKKQGTHS